MNPDLTTTPAVTAESVREVLETALVDLGIEKDAITADTRLRADLEFDSTETVQISLDLTRAFGVKVKLEEAGDPTLAEIGALVLALCDSGGPEA